MDYNIKELGKQAGITKRTINYYESIGILTPKSYKRDGEIIYREEVLQSLYEIDFLKQLNFSLKEIKKIINVNNENTLQILNLYREFLSDKCNCLEKCLEGNDYVERAAYFKISQIKIAYLNRLKEICDI